MVDILDVACYMIFLSYGNSKYSLTQLKLQKLLYLVQGWSYVWDGCPIFIDDFCAWLYGPANEKVYESFRKYGRAEIPEAEGYDKIKDEDIKETIEAVWLEYGKLTAYDLVKLVCLQNPWKDAYSSGTRITNRSIQTYFQLTFS